MKTAKIITLQEYTSLPLEVISVADRMLPDVIVQTPHKGKVQVALKKEHYPFLFGSVTQTDVHAREVLGKIWRLQEEAQDFLMDAWKKSLKTN